jgi:hypothetical protein
MEWHEWYGPDHAPGFEEISSFVDSTLWDEARGTLEDGFQVAPRLEYSRCSMQKGWNVKYKKSGRSLCTLYPMAGYFLALVVIGQREELSIPAVLPALNEETKALYHRTPVSMGCRWLMLKVGDEAALQDLISLVRLRAAS